MFCAHCGNQLKAHNKFCAICGSPVNFQEKKTDGVDTKIEESEMLEKEHSGKSSGGKSNTTNSYILAGLLVMVVIFLIIIIQYGGKLQSLKTEYLELQNKNKQLESEIKQLESEKTSLESEKEEIISEVNRTFDGLFERYPDVLEEMDREMESYKEEVVKEIDYFLKMECSIDEVRSEIIKAGGATVTIQTGCPVISSVDRLNDDISEVIPQKIGISWLERYNWSQEIDIIVDDEDIITIDSGYEVIVL